MTNTASTRDRGFTLVEILIAIVLVGILSAVVVVGISNLTSKGSTSACNASLDAAKAGTVVYYASNANAYPKTFNDLTKAPDAKTPAAVTLPTGVTVDSTGLVASNSSWKLTMKAGASANLPPTFACS